MKRENQTYEAFISYRHLPADIFVAEQLHKLLERYSIPKTARRAPGEKHIGHIFRDKDELPVSMDLGESIENALKESKILIVICTSETKNSEWVNREIEEFIRLHGRKNIVCVLAEGEPEDSIPKQLLQTEDPDHPGQWIQTEPLAADIRGKSRSETRKKLKKEKLRIMAQILNVTYDTLVQRDRIYRKKKMTAVSLAGAAAMAIVSIVGTIQTNRIQNLRMLTMKEEARESVKTAQSRLDQGDRIGAIKVLLTSYDAHRGLEVPEQYSAFNSILHPYEDSNPLTLNPCEKITTDVLNSLTWSPDGKWAAASGDGLAAIYNLETGLMQKSLRVSDLDRKYKDRSIQIDGIRIVSDQKAIAWVEGDLYQLDLDTGKVLKNSLSGLEDGDGPVSIAANAGQRMWLVGSDSYSCIDTETLDVLTSQKKSWNSDSVLPSRIRLSEDGERAAFLLRDYEMMKTVKSAGETASDAELLPCKRQVLTASTKEMGKMIEEPSIMDALWMPDQSLILLSKEDADSPYARLTSFRNGKKEFSWGSYRMEDWSESPVLSLLNYQGEMLPAVRSGKSVVLSDPKTKQTVWDMEFSSPVNQVISKDQETFLVMTGENRIGLVTYHSPAVNGPLVWYRVETGLNLIQFHPSYKNGTLHQIAAEYRQSGEWGISAFRALVPEEGESITTGTLIDLRCGKLADGTDYQMSVGTNGQDYLISLVADENGSLLYSTSIDTAETPYDLYPNFTVIQDEGKDLLVWNSGRTLVCEDLETGTRSQLFPSAAAVSAFSISPDGNQLYICSSRDGILDENGIYEKSGPGWILKKNLDEDIQVRRAEWTENGTRLILGGTDWAKVWNSENSSFLPVQGTDKLENLTPDYGGVDSYVGFSAGWRTGKEHDWILICQNEEEGGLLKVIDLENGSIKTEIRAQQAGVESFDLFEPDSADFTDHDRKLVLKTASAGTAQEEGTYQILVINLENGSVISRLSLSNEMTELLPSHLQADNEGKHFTLGSNGSSISYNDDTGWLRSGQALFELQDGQPVIKARFNTSKVFFDPDHQVLAANFSDTTHFNKLVSYESLVQEARKLVEEYETGKKDE